MDFFSNMGFINEKSINMGLLMDFFINMGFINEKIH